MTTTTIDPAGTPPAVPDGRRQAGLRRFAVRLGSLVLLIAVWWAVAKAEIWSPLLVPSPGKVWDAFVESVTSDGRRRGLSNHFLWEHLRASLSRIVRGVGWGLLAGLVVGLVLATVRPLRTVIEPYVSFLRSLPPLAYFSILIIWFGIDDASKIWLLFLTAFPPVTLATLAGVERVRPEFVEAARALGASRYQVVRYAVLPSAIPDVVTGVRLALGFAWTTIVAAETANGIPGIGGLAWATKAQNRTDVAILCVIVIGLTALALDAAVRALERRFVPWKDRA